MKKIGIVMGSDSDMPVVSKAIGVLREYGVPYEVHVYSAHRTPEEARDFALTARERGLGAIIAAAGMAAHLAGAIAANTTLPVIGIPVKSKNLDGIDALLSTVQMPTGLPVATVAIDGAANAPPCFRCRYLRWPTVILPQSLTQHAPRDAKRCLQRTAPRKKNSTGK